MIFCHFPYSENMFAVTQGLLVVPAHTLARRPGGQQLLVPGRHQRQRLRAQAPQGSTVSTSSCQQ